MQNPQISSNLIPSKTMYLYSNHTNIPWNIPQYNVPVIHNDYKQIMRQRMYAAQKKGVKTNDFYITKRGFYMDYDLKVHKGIPAGPDHIQQKPWDGTQIKLQGQMLKTARSSIKYTYLQRIQMQQKARPIPSVSKYPLQKSFQQKQQQIKELKSKKQSVGQKRYFHQDVSFLSQKVPGSGHYNPHDEVEHVKKNKTDWKFWSTKHSNWDKTFTKRQSVIPAPGTYTPIAQQYRSFSAFQKIDKKKKQIKNGFGSDSRFPYTRPNKKVVIMKQPGPTAYQTHIDWKGKSVSPKKAQWIKMIWKGSPPKVY